MDVNGAKPLLSYAVARECGYEIQRAGRGIDECCAGDSNFTSKCCSTAEIVRQWGHTARCVEVMALPQRACGRIIGVYGVYAVVLGSQDDHIVCGASNWKTSHVKGLGDQQSIGLKAAQLSELIYVDLGWRQNGFIRVESLAGNIAFPHQHTAQRGSGRRRR